MTRQILTKTNKTHKTKTKVVIVADGETEKDYITRIKELGVTGNLQIKFIKGNEDNFKTILQENFNIPTFLILDIDNSYNLNIKRYHKLDELYKKKELEPIIFYNNYSFETWLLNHKVKFSRSIQYSEKYNSAIKRVFGIDSWSGNKTQRNREKMMSQINKEDILRAKENVSRIYSNDLTKNPNSNMHLLCDKLLKIR